MTRKLVLAVFLLLPFASCGDDSSGDHLPLPSNFKPGESPPPAAPAAGAQPPSSTATRSVRSGAAPAAAAPVSDPIKETVLETARKRPFANEDFIESETNRDPFHSYLGELSGSTKVHTQYKILMPRSSLEELKLLAIISPPSGSYESDSETEAGDRGESVSQSGAMFRDSTGLGVWVSRGDHISRADAKVVRITSDRVYIEVQEDVGNGKLRLVQRAIELHLGEPQEGP